MSKMDEIIKEAEEIIIISGEGEMGTEEDYIGGFTMEFKNKELFFNWLRGVITATEIDENAYLEDVSTQYGSTGMTIYEVPGYATKSGRVEEYRYTVEDDVIVF